MSIKFEKNHKISLGDFNLLKVRIGAKSQRNQELLTKHEFGFGRTPPRSPLRVGYSNASKNLNTISEKLLGKVVDGKITYRQMLDSIGEYVKNEVKIGISQRLEPVLSKVTLKLKMENNKTDVPLIYSGEMWRSIDFEVDT